MVIASPLMCPPVEVDDDMAGDGLAGSIALDVGDRRFYFSPSRDLSWAKQKKIIFKDMSPRV